MKVLIENNGKGHSDAFAPVRIDGAARGAVEWARVTGRDSDELIAEWA
jgi:hypothetical protein